MTDYFQKFKLYFYIPLPPHRRRQGRCVSVFVNRSRTTTYHYLWTPNQQDKLIADTTTSGILWALTDHLGTIRDVLDGNSSTHLIYDAFGNLTSGTNPLLFGYTGKAFDTATNLQNNINRWYDATIGRWLSVDPIGFEGNDTNLYRYVYNNPIIYSDFEGLKKRKTSPQRPNYKIRIPDGASREVKDIIQALNKSPNAQQFFIKLIDQDHCKIHGIANSREKGQECPSRETSGYILKHITKNQYRIWEFQHPDNTADRFIPYQPDGAVPTSLPKIPSIPDLEKRPNQVEPSPASPIDKNYRVILMWHTHPCGGPEPSCSCDDPVYNDWDLAGRYPGLLYLVLSKQGTNYVFYFYYLENGEQKMFELEAEEIR